MSMRRVLITHAARAVFAVAASIPAIAQTEVGRWRWIDPFPTGVDLFDVVAHRDGAVTAVGDHSTIMQSSDRGASWTMRHVGDYRQLNAVTSASTVLVVAV